MALIYPSEKTFEFSRDPPIYIFRFGSYLVHKVIEGGLDGPSREVVRCSITNKVIEVDSHFYVKKTFVKPKKKKNLNSF